MSRMEMYCIVLSETLPLSKQVLIAKLQSFIDRNRQWRDYFNTEVRPYEEEAFAQKIREQQDILLAWLLVGGGITPSTPQEKSGTC